MKGIKVKVIGSDKIYWLTAKQAHQAVEEMRKDKNALLTLGNDMVKGSAIKTFENGEINVDDAPTYFIEAVKAENKGALPMPRREIQKITKKYDKDGNELHGTYRKLVEGGVNVIIEKDYQTLDGELGEVLEERRIEFRLYAEGYYPVITSIKRRGVETLGEKPNDMI